jgi:hypothetical protein
MVRDFGKGMVSIHIDSLWVALGCFGRTCILEEGTISMNNGEDETQHI